MTIFYSKFHSFCHCHLEANEGSTSHEHFHGLVHFIDDKKYNLKKTDTTMWNEIK